MFFSLLALPGYSLSHTKDSKPAVTVSIEAVTLDTGGFNIPGHTGSRDKYNIVR